MSFYFMFILFFTFSFSSNIPKLPDNKNDVTLIDRAGILFSVT